MHQHDEAERRSAGVVELLQLDDDQQRRDLGLHRQVAGDEDHRAVLADRARERQREAGRERRQHRRQDDAAEDREAAGAERFGRVLEIALHFEQRRLHRAHHERQADQRQRHDDADPGVGDLDAERREVLADPAVLGEHGGQRDARHRGRQRERHVDQRVDQLAARKLVAHQRPGDDEAEHAVERRREQRRAEAQAIRGDRARIEQHAHEVVPAHRRRLHDQRRERDQHDRAQEERRRSRASGRSPGRIEGVRNSSRSLRP